MRFPSLAGLINQYNRRLVIEPDVMSLQSHDLRMPHAGFGDYPDARQRLPATIVPLHAGDESIENLEHLLQW